MIWPFDKVSEQLQALEHSQALDRTQRQSELTGIKQALEHAISDDRQQRKAEQAAILQALSQHRESTSTEITAKLQEVQQSVLSEMRRLQLPANFAQMLRDEFATRMSSLEGNMQLLLQSFITTQKEVQQLNTLLAGLPNELETIHTQFRGALTRDLALFKNELFNTMPTQVPYGDDLIEQLNREFAQLRSELLAALSARAPVTEPMPSLALAPFDGQRPVQEQVSERLVPVFQALVALETGYAAWIAEREAQLRVALKAARAHLQDIETGAYHSQPPPLPPSNGAEPEPSEQHTVVVEEAQDI